MHRSMEPLHLETIERRPLLQRGRYLMFAWDDDIGETRCFYLCQLTATPGDAQCRCIVAGPGPPCHRTELRCDTG